MAIPVYPEIKIKTMNALNLSPVYKLIFVALLLMGLACKTRKVVPVVDNSAQERSNAEKLAVIKLAQADFNTLAIKARAELDVDGNNNEVSINIRMQKDKKIWISVTALAGLEAARVLITPDSIHVLNRLESIYLKKPFSFIHEYTNPQISFQTVQSILLANLTEEAATQKPEFSMDNDRLTLSGISSSLAYQLHFTETMRVSGTSLRDTLNGQQLQVNYSDFYLESSGLFPHQLKLQSQAGAKSIKAEMKYTKIEKDIAIDFPFSVPKRFSVKK